jgi:hypothetical protein
VKGAGLSSSSVGFRVQGSGLRVYVSGRGV